MELAGSSRLNLASESQTTGTGDAHLTASRDPAHSKVVRICKSDGWRYQGSAAERDAHQRFLEHGGVLYFPKLGFELMPHERKFLSQRWSDEKRKNVSLAGPDAPLRGALGEPDELQSLREMIARYAEGSERLVDDLFPGYRDHLKRAGTSFRPRAVTVPLSARRDDTRLHVDAFPSNPIRGQRLLRVFTNIDPKRAPRVWRVGEPFADFARRFIARTRAPLPWASRLLAALGITKRPRSEYDHRMLQLHDLVKTDLDYQANAPQHWLEFPAGATWLVFSDQVLHAAMAGQFMMEQSFYLDPAGSLEPDSAPVAILSALLGRRLV